jgi:hypothetical protein
MTNERAGLSTDVYEAVVAVCGETLYWKRTLKRIFRQAGVSQTAIDRYEALGKFQMARAVLDALDNAGPRGAQVQRNLVNALANLAQPEDGVPDLAAGRQALEHLRAVAKAKSLLVDPEEEQRRQRQETAAAERLERSQREAKMLELRNQFRALHGSDNKQARGYALERLLRDLFRVHELDFNASYKTETDQIDGSLVVDAFTYLLEARWRTKPAADAELGGLTHKVERRLDATRGLFLSMAGFRDEAVNLYRLAKENRLILMDGQDLSLILEGHFDLLDALREKIRTAATLGEPYVRLAELRS